MMPQSIYNDHPVTRTHERNMGIESTETAAFLKLPPEKRKRIVDAAIAEFAENGYKGASMNALVKRAGISKGAIFKYFRTKKGLFAFVYNTALQHVKAYLRAVRDGSTDENFFVRLEKVMFGGIRFIQGNEALSRIYYRIAYTDDSPYKNEILEELNGESIRFLSALIENGVQRGEIRPDIDAETGAFILQSILDRFLQLQLHPISNGVFSQTEHAGNDPSERIEKIAAIVRKGFANNEEPIQR